MDVKKRLTLALGGAAILAAEWLLIRFPLFGLHWMKEWPLDLLIVGLVAVAVAGILGAKWAVLGTLAGYLTGFFCGLIYNPPGPNGTRLGPLVWMFVFLAGILLGIAVSVVSAWRRGKAPC